MLHSFSSVLRLRLEYHFYLITFMRPEGETLTAFILLSALVFGLCLNPAY